MRISRRVSPVLFPSPMSVRNEISHYDVHQQSDDHSDVDDVVVIVVAAADDTVVVVVDDDGRVMIKRTRMAGVDYMVG